MARPSSTSVPSPAFVGRSEELGAILDALGPDSRDVFYCWSPGGVGKTALLRRAEATARERSTPVLWVDARDLEPSPPAIEAAIARAAGAPPSTPAAEAVAAAGPCLLVLDTVESIAAALPWLFGELLASLPAGAVTLMASRDPLPSQWRTDLEWLPRLHPLPLRNLGPRESTELLTAHGVTEADHAEIFAFTLGHPLALTIVAESLRSSGSRFAHMPRGDVVHDLVARFTRDIHEPLQRRALEAACVVRVINEPILRTLLEIDDSYELFRWLRELSFFETVHDGLRPHQTVRRAVTEDLRFRDPDWHDHLRQRAHEHFEARAKAGPGDDATQIAHLYDLSFLHSQNPVARRFFDWSADRPLFAAHPSPKEVAALERVIARHEGQESVRWFRYWLERQPERCHVFRDQTLEVMGYHCAPVLTASGLEAARADPAVATMTSAIAQRGSLRGSEVAILTRFWLTPHAYQRVDPVQSHMWLHMVRTYGLTPHLAYGLSVFHDVDAWEPVFTYMGFSRAGEFSVGDHRFGLMMHDWRARPYLEWLELLARRQTSFAPVAPAEVPPPPAVLDRQTFAHAVKDALRHRSDAHALGRNPLLDTRLVRGDLGLDASTSERLARLRDRLDEACAALAATTGFDKQARAVAAVYERGAPSQEAAAEALGVPLSSFRRHLKRGVELVVERLWEDEIGSGGAP